MAELKTRKTGASVQDFINSVAEDRKRQDSFTLLHLFRDVTGAEPSMWGENIVGFGHYHYKYASGRENDWFETGFSPRKQNLTLYLYGGFDKLNDLLGRLGKFSLGKGCLYIKKLDDVDQDVLRDLVKRSVTNLRSGSFGDSSGRATPGA